MLRRKKTNGLYGLNKVYQGSILLLLWILGGYATLQALKSTDNRSLPPITHSYQSPSPMVKSIPERQIDPARDCSSCPSFSSVGPNYLSQTPVPTWYVTPEPFMGYYPSYSSTPNRSMTPTFSFINMANPLASPSYYLPEGTLGDSDNLPSQNHGASSISYAFSNMPNFLSHKSTSPPHTTSLKKKPTKTTVRPKKTADKSKQVLSTCAKRSEAFTESRAVDGCTKTKSISKFFSSGNKGLSYNLTKHIKGDTKEKKSSNEGDRAKSQSKYLGTSKQQSGTIKCIYCSKRFAQQGNLTVHLRTHTNEKPFKCTYCSKAFSHKSNLTKHLRTHTDEKPFQCTYCSKRFSQADTLKGHIRIHTNEKPYSCTYCHKKFTRQSNLIAHLRTHTKEKPYTCSYCPKKFGQKSTLTRHLRTHTKEKPFACNYCIKRFSQKHSLKRHVKSQHS